MNVWVGGADGLIAQVDLFKMVLLQVTLRNSAWVHSLVRYGKWLYVLAGDILWIFELTPENKPELLVEKPLQQIEPSDICVVPSGKRLLLGIATGSGVSFLDAKTLEGVDYFDVSEGVHDVRPAGPDAIVYSSHDGYVGHYDFRTRHFEPYFAINGLGGRRVNDLCSDEGGVLCVSLDVGYLAWYDKPGPPTGNIRLSNSNLGGVAMNKRFWLVARENEVVAVSRDNLRQTILTSPVPSKKTRIVVQSDIIIVLDENGTLWAYSSKSLRTNTTLSPMASIATQINDTYALCT
jgi:hypothetical protein